MPEKNGEYVQCDNCGKMVYKTRYQINNKQRHYCSARCSAEGSSKLHREDRKCEYCGKTFNVVKSSKVRFCSTLCQHQWQKGNTGLLNPKFMGEITKCDSCGKEIQVGKSSMERYTNHFCSNACRMKWYGDVWSKREDWIQQSRIRGAETQRKQTTKTKPQIMVNNLLHELNIKYINEERFGMYSVDNYLPDYNLIIEVNGDYWHCSPIKYSSITNKIQNRAVQRDTLKKSYILQNHGIHILYLWESDIYDRIELCAALINKYISNQGVLQNYNSFNYSMINGILELNQNIYTTFQELSVA